MTRPCLTHDLLCETVHALIVHEDRYYTQPVLVLWNRRLGVIIVLRLNNKHERPIADR
jgi:hypothetical protein